MRRILVGGSFKHTGVWVCFIAGAGCFAVAAAISSKSSAGVVPLAAVGGAFLLAFGALLVRQVARRAWLEISEQGFRLLRGSTVEEHRDDAVQSMSVEQHLHYAEGVPKAITFTVRLWVDAEGVDPPIVLVHKADLGLLDNPLPEFLDRVGASLTERRKADIGRGQTVRGDGWSLDRTGLRFGDELTGEHLRYSDMNAVDVFDDQVMVWRLGEEEASFKLPLSERDSYLLLHLLPGFIPERSDTAETTGLGRVLFERALKDTKQGLLILGVLVAVIAGIIVGAEIADKQWGSALSVGSAVALGAGLVAAVAGAILPAGRLRCHESGVVLESAFGAEKRLRYLDVGSFTYHGTRMYYNGVYTGTSMQMTFLPRPGVVAEPITYKTTLKQEDPALELLRDHISKVVAGQMAKDLAEGKVVEWTDNLRILPTRSDGESGGGIEHRPAGWIGRKEPVVYPFDQVADFGIDQGWFHLWLKGSEKSVIQEEVAQRNFFPGFYLLALLFSPPAEEGAEGSEAPGEEPS